MKVIYLFLLLHLAILKSFAQNTTTQVLVDKAASELAAVLQTGDSLAIAEAYYVLGKRQITHFDLESAYESFHHSLTIYRSLQNHYFVGKIYLRMAELEKYQRNFEKALKYTFVALQLYEEHKLDRGALHCYEFLAELYIELENTLVVNPTTEKRKLVLLDSAYYYAKRGERIAAENNNEHSLSKFRFNLGRVYLLRKDPKALEYLENVAELQRSSKRADTEQVRVLTALAHGYMMFQDLAKAGIALAKSQAIIDQSANMNQAEKANHHLTYANYYKLIQEWEKAYQQRELASEILERIAASERKVVMSKWRIQLDTEKKELMLQSRAQELKARNKLIDQQKLIITLVVTSLLFVAVLCYFLYINFKKQRSLTQKNAFLVQEQSHRVKNNLQVVSSLLHLQEDYVDDIVTQQVLAESQTRINAMILLHSQLYQNDVIDLIDLEELFLAIIESVAATFGVKHFEARCELEDENVDPDLATSMGVIFNELVINSFKHVNYESYPTIEVTSIKHGEVITMTYTDYGKFNYGAVFETPEKKGFGLKLIDMLLFQIDGKLHYSFEEYAKLTLTFKVK